MRKGEIFFQAAECRLQDTHGVHIPKHQKHIMKKEEKAKRQ
jgi:hypothetical protein